MKQTKNKKEDELPNLKSENRRLRWQSNKCLPCDPIEDDEPGYYLVHTTWSILSHVQPVKSIRGRTVSPRTVLMVSGDRQKRATSVAPTIDWCWTVANDDHGVCSNIRGLATDLSRSNGFGK
jgi:hypothetical protein